MKDAKEKPIVNNHFILDTYYQGIVSIFDSEIEYITNLISHRGIKGQANEE
ncbi:hypothetical protein [Candidatus Nitrosocosmicus arcticus]|uniref:Uncharacterized protein n=1 Tax=Candidatus Nitrosocosmicus arcticus TaxID=2035267 RepID=A0A557SVY3_9ARCH|nr:hypothetical protein [Candidatus Nitrosocosmicus arcticus]TVP40765.1 hypothetical protein NARC_60152 [Candidatus Nitrosocosmicus arcticus]